MGGHVLESWKEEMIRIGRVEGRAEGHAEGRAEGHAEGRVIGHAEGSECKLLENLQAVMTNLNLTAEKAMDVLNVPQEERTKYLQQLQ